MPPARTFVVDATVGRKMAGMPWGRLDVADDELVVRCWLIPAFRPRSVTRSTITAIFLYRRMSRNRLKVEDIEGAFSAVSIALPVKAEAVIEELRQRGYPIIDPR